MDPSAQWFQVNLDLVSFVYGAAFVLLGTVILTQASRGGDFRLGAILWLLAVFGLIQGLTEWTVTSPLFYGNGEYKAAVRLGAHVASFLILFEFGRRFALINRDEYEARGRLVHPLGIWLYVPLLVPLAAAWFFATSPILAADVWIRYSAAFAGSLLTAVGFWEYRRRNQRRLSVIGAKGFFAVAAVAMAVYGVIAGLVGPAVDFFPANRLNDESFARVTGVPVMAVRSALAVVLSVAVGAIVYLFNRESRLAFQDALARANRRSQKILHAAGEGILELDRNGKVLFANPAAQRMLGRQETEMIGKVLHRLIRHNRGDGRLFPGEVSPIQIACVSGRSHRGAGEGFTHRDGTIFPVDYSCTPIQEGRELLGSVLTFNDISEREKLNMLVRDTQALAKVGGWEYELDKRTLSWTDEVFRIHDLQPGSDIDFYTAVDFYHPESRAIFRKAVDEAIEQGRNFDLELKIVTASERLIWVRTIGRPHVRNGRTYRLSGTYQDITERKQTETALRDNTDFYELILDSVPIRIAYVNADGRIAYVNKAYEEWFEAPRASILGRTIREVTTDESYRKIKPRMERVLAGERVNYQVSVERDGKNTELDVEYLPHLSRQNEVRGFFSVVHDMTEHKELEAKLLQAQKMEAVGQLTGGLAHDFNNLLSVIMGNLQLLERPLRQEPKMHKKVKTATRAARRGADLTRRLLAFSRRQMLEPETLDLNALLAGLDELLRRTLGEGVEVSSSFADDLWLTTVDPGQLENAILNLAINARDAMPAGGTLTLETANVTLSPAYCEEHPDVSPGDYVMVAVSDTGLGMDTLILERAFDPFFTTKEVGKGSGMGLSMVYGFVEQSGGHANIYSEKDHGTSVKIYLPRTHSGIAAKREETALHKFMPGGSETILVAEDEDDVRETVVIQLKELGYTILEAANGPDALEIIKNRPDIDLLFTDVMMPGGMHGPVLASRAQEIRPALKVLFTSGYAESAIMHRGVLAESSEMIGKPYEHQELALKIRLLLDKDELRDAR